MYAENMWHKGITLSHHKCNEPQPLQCPHGEVLQPPRQGMPCTFRIRVRVDLVAASASLGCIRDPHRKALQPPRQGMPRTFRIWVRVDLVAASALLSCIRAKLPCQVSTVTPHLRNHQAQKCQGSLLWHPRRMALCMPKNAQMCRLVCPSVPTCG